jgi:hypothetical protein
VNWGGWLRTLATSNSVHTFFAGGLQHAGDQRNAGKPAFLENHEAPAAGALIRDHQKR